MRPFVQLATVLSGSQHLLESGCSGQYMHHRRHRWLAAKIVRPSCAPVVHIEGVRPRWPLFGRQTTLNVATYCAPVSSISAGQQRNGQVAEARDTVYGSDADQPQPPYASVARELTVCVCAFRRGDTLVLTSACC